MLSGKALQNIAAAAVAEDPHEALNEALEILESAYGTARKQCRALLDQLLARPKVAPTEAALLEFHGDLLRCYRIMTRCNRGLDLDSAEVLRGLFAKLPEFIQNIWERKCTHTRPSFKLLMDVVKEEHLLKTGDINYWREELRKTKKDSSSKVSDSKKFDGKSNVKAPVKINLLSHNAGEQATHNKKSVPPTRSLSY